MMQYWARPTAKASTLLESTFCRNATRARAFNDQAAHVGHVEDPAIPAGIQMLGHNATGVLDGHFPPAKVHQVAPAATWVSCNGVSLSSLIRLYLLCIAKYYRPI